MKDQIPIARLGFSPPNASRFGGGGRTAAPAVITAPPISQLTPPAAVAPASATSAEVAQTQADLRRQSLKKRGFSKTVFAGDTGGWSSPNSGVPSPTNPKQATGGGLGAGARTLGS